MFCFSFFILKNANLVIGFRSEKLVRCVLNMLYLFFKKKNWRKALLDHFTQHKRDFDAGHFKRIENKEEASVSMLESKETIEKRLHNSCLFFSLPLYQDFPGMMKMAQASGYHAVLAGPSSVCHENSKVFLFKKFPSFWIKFLTYF